MAFMPRGEPQSVPDPDGDRYDEMLRKYGAANGIDEGPKVSASRGASSDQSVRSDQHDVLTATGQAATHVVQNFFAKDANGRPLHPIGHPGFAESFLPVVGSSHEALADLQEGHPWLATGNAALAVAEATGVGTVMDDVIKGGLRVGRSQTWGALRKAYLKEGLVEPFQPGHHIIQRQHIPKWVPDRLTNHWLNVIPMKDQIIDGVAHTGAQVHRRLHGRAMVEGVLMPEFNALQKFQYGTKASTWALMASVGGASARLVQGAENYINSTPPPPFAPLPPMLK